MNSNDKTMKQLATLRRQLTTYKNRCIRLQREWAAKKEIIERAERIVNAVREAGDFMEGDEYEMYLVPGGPEDA